MNTSNDARREVARQLAGYSIDGLVDGSLERTLEDVTGTTSWQGVLIALEMLIKPPMCRMKRIDVTHPLYDSPDEYRCTRCRAEMPRSAFMHYQWPDRCPSCGAEVVLVDD